MRGTTDNSKAAIRLSYFVAAFFWFLCLLFIGLIPAFFLCLLGLLLVTGRMMLKAQRTDLDDPADSLRTFKGEQVTGWLFGLFLLAGFLAT